MDAFFDTGLLRKHTLDLAETKRKIQSLSDQLKSLQEMEELLGGSSGTALLNKTNQLSEYYRRLAEKLEEFCTDVETEYSQKGDELEQAADYLYSMLRKNAFIE